MSFALFLFLLLVLTGAVWAIDSIWFAKKRLAEGRQQHRRKDGDDGNNHQQLDQRESPLGQWQISSLHFKTRFLLKRRNLPSK